jgi:hypothetical protein
MKVKKWLYVTAERSPVRERIPVSTGRRCAALAVANGPFLVESERLYFFVAAAGDSKSPLELALRSQKTTHLRKSMRNIVSLWVHR